MDNNQPQNQPPAILQLAWTKFAQFDDSSNLRTKAHLRLRRWIGALGVLATLFAILTETFPASQFGVMGLALQFLLILTPISASVLAAYTSKFYAGGDWLITRAGAEEIRKEIFSYRTILQNTPNRKNWLENRLADIQRSVYRGMNGELTMSTYEGPLPSVYNPEDPYSDPGFHDLTGDEYFKYRLESQLAWHQSRVVRRQSERVRLQWLILISGGLGAVLAAIVPLWVALTAAFTAVFIGWQELRNLDEVVRNYSKVIIELSIVSDHWRNLDENEKNQSEFFKMVRATEDVLWNQNVEYIKSMQEALKDSDLEEEASLINRVIKEAKDSDKRLKESIADAVVEVTREKLTESEEKLAETFETALRTLAEEASSELVQAELAAMQEAAEKALKTISDRLGLSSALESIAEEFKGVPINSDTPMSVLNDLMSRYPKTADVKG